MKKIISYITVFSVFLIFAGRTAHVQAAATLTVCATGTVGQEGCNYIGGNGIQQAINDISPSSTIYIKPGVYNVTHISISKSDITILGTDSILNINDNGLHGYGINIERDAKNITIIGLNLRVINSGGFYIGSLNSGTILLQRNIVTNVNPQVSSNQINGVWVDTSVPLIILDHDVFYRMEGYGVKIDIVPKAPLYIKNSIFSSTRKFGSSGGCGIYYVEQNPSNSNIVPSYNLFSGNETACACSASPLNWCTSNSSINGLDPKFVDPAHSDFHLLSGSPAIDAGDPGSGLNDPDRSRGDIGAYGGPTAGLQYYAGLVYNGNLIGNPDVENGLEFPWTKWWSGGSGYAMNIVSGGAEGSTKAWEITIGNTVTEYGRTGSVYQGRYYVNTPQLNNLANFAGKWIKYGGYYKTSANTNIRFQLSKRVNNNWITWWSPEGILGDFTSSTWKKAEKTIFVPIDTQGLDLTALAIGLNTGGGEKVWFDNLFIETTTAPNVTMTITPTPTRTPTPAPATTFTVCATGTADREGVTI